MPCFIVNVILLIENYLLNETSLRGNYKNKMNYKKITGALSLALLVMTPLLFSGCGKESLDIASYKLDLEVWGVFDDSEYFAEVNDAFLVSNSNVARVTYKKISSNPKIFEEELIDAFASGNGPDVFFFHNTWLPKHKDKIAAMADSNKFSLDHKNEFVDVVYDDFYQDGEFFALPLHCDTLALYYNKHALTQAGIIAPPITWNEVMEQTKRLTKIDEFGNITQSAIALGRSKSPGAINRSSDILVLMMLQNGALLHEGNINFSKSTNVSSPGETALNFYTQFAQANSDVYTWNSKKHYSNDSFRDGNVVMVLGYPYKIEQLKKIAPKLDFDVAPVPQLNPQNKISFANYWGLAAAKNAAIPDGAKYNNDQRTKEAWSYINFVTTKPKNSEFDPTKVYLEKSNKISARKDLIVEQSQDPVMGVFAEQALTARSWQVPDEFVADDVIETAIDEVISGTNDARKALSKAATRLNSLWKK